MTLLTTISAVLIVACKNKVENSKIDNTDKLANRIVVSQSYVKANDSICISWEAPQSKEIFQYLSAFDKIEPYEWNQCYANLNCGIKGSLIYENEMFEFDLNAGGWIKLVDGNQRETYFGCKDNHNTRFISTYYCDEDWD